MSNLYRGARQLMLTGAFNWTSTSLKAMLVGPDYVPNFDTDATLSNVPGTAQLTTLKPITSPTVVAGSAFAANLTWTNLLTTDHVVGVLIMIDNASGVQATFPLVLLLNVGPGFGISPLHEDTSVVWDAVTGVFTL